MNNTDLIAGSVFGGVLIALGCVLALVYLSAPFVLYGIYSRLGRLIELQEHAISREQPPQPTPEQRAAELTAARAQWGKL